jgi:beta-glucanase (GH16 family)
MFQWYFRVRNSHRFDDIKRWNPSFADEFDAPKLDKTRWLPRYFWGDVVLKDSYAKEGEKQFYPDDQNIEISNSILKINTRRQKYTGKAWNPAIGFYPHEFNYTSGIINTGARFRQQYGLFEAKIRFNRNYPVNHAFWLISDLMLPHIDIARAGKKISVGTFWGNPNAKNGIDKVSTSMSRSRFGNDYHIFSLEWTQEKLVWKVNGVVICTSTRGVPQIPMYVNINSALYSEPNGTSLPAELDVDWVRCYRTA